jgi:O-antigen/teichoic acid export membrane protein
MLNALNGARRLALFGILTTVRYAFMSAIATALAVMAAPLPRLGLIFSLSEALLFPILAAVCLHVFPGPRLAAPRQWIARNVQFGLRSIVGGIAVELNTRVDVLILGLFASDAGVGVYSFAAFFVEGLLQIPMLARRFIDPRLTSLVVKGDKPLIGDLVRRARSANAALVLALNLLAVAFYSRYAVLVGPEPLVAASESLFFILSAGAAFFGVYAVFSGILSQGGLPSAQTRYNLHFLFVNVLLNLCLAPFWGPTGSAIGTSLSFVAGALLLRRAVLRHLDIRI